MPGMLRVMAQPYQGETHFRVVDAIGKQEAGKITDYPDLSDPATLGCLLALVREAWKNQQVHVVKLAYGFMSWQAWNADRDIAAKCATEVEALVAALEAAP
jgi:hypothetical protein